MKINQYIDHTLLKPTALKSEIIELCKQALEYQFYAVCVNPYWVSLASDYLKESQVKIAAVVGFPLGTNTTQIKVDEAKKAIFDGAHEVDMVINHSMIAEGRYEEYFEEIRSIKKVIGNQVLKVIIETCYLNNDQIVKASRLSVEAGADFVKTSTGFGTGGATFEHITLMKETVGNKAKLKASGGVRDYETAKQYIEKGVSRLGTSSGVAIVNGTKSEEGY